MSDLGQIAFAEYYGRQAGAALVMPESWAMQSDAGRADWEAAAAAVAAHVPRPTDKDYDHAAEILKLRGQLRAIKMIAEPVALGGTPRAILAQAVLGQMDADL